MRRHWVVVVVVAAGVVGAVSGCGDDGSDGAALEATGGSTTTTTEAGTTTTSSTEETTTTSTDAVTSITEPLEELPDSEDSGLSELADGEHFGFWSSFQIGDTIAFGEFDLAYLLTGEGAEAAATERGEELELDYYIVNDNPRLRTLIAHGDTEVLVLTGNGDEHESSNVADFAVDRNVDSGYWVTIEDGIVTELEEQYLP